jgi:hypothetical protein
MLLIYNMEKISDRILEIVHNEGISIRSLERKIACSNGVLAKCIQKGTDINSVWLSKIIETLPGYNADWLLTGRGEKLINKNDRNADDNYITGSDICLEDITECKKCHIIDELTTILRQQIETHLKLINYLEEKKA